MDGEVKKQNSAVLAPTAIGVWQIEGRIIRDGKETIPEGVCSSGKRAVSDPEFPDTFERRAMR